MEARNVRRLARGAILVSMGVMVGLLGIALLGGEEISPATLGVLLVWLLWAGYMVFRSQLLKG